jgi:SWI/SNF-related matrix-associated actin-dependent regulator of chromatin subfamily A3
MSTDRHVIGGRISYYKYHGPKRHLSVMGDLPHQIIFTTYATVAADFSQGGGVLDKFFWHRLVLDEGSFAGFCL